MPLDTFKPIALGRVSRIICACLILALSSLTFTRYLQWQPDLLFFALIYAVVLFTLKQRSFLTVGKRTLIALAAFAVLLDISLVLGFHIVIGPVDYNPNESGLEALVFYYGLSTDNYISPYSLADGAAFVVMLPAIFTLTLTPFALLTTTRRADGAFRKNKIVVTKVNRKWLWIGAVILFALWVPYLIAYWPGFIFGDSLNSIRQALGATHWSNHFPIAYTAFIGLCLEFAHALGLGNTAGCALYSVLQMGFMAICFSYTAQWIVTRGGLRLRWNLLLLAAWGLTPFIAVYSIAMWKDPLFSSAIMVLSLLLMDFIWTEGRIIRTCRPWLPVFVFLMLIIALFRTNGLIVIAAVTVFFAVLSIRNKHLSGKAPEMTLATTVTAIILIASALFYGPVTTALNVEKNESSEGAGILYNQMARVVTYEGNMTEDNKVYLDSLLPIDLYPQTYHPCCFDELKYAFMGNGASFETRRLLYNWAQMFVTNPHLYFEAWELQTFGFWSINTPGLTSFPNIRAGYPRNTTTNVNYFTQTVDEFGIDVTLNVPGDIEIWRNLFPQDTWQPPAGLLFWLALYLALCCWALRRGAWALSLVPTLLLFFSMFIATPICYWPRYVAAAYFLIPFYIFLGFVLLRDSRIEKNS